MIRRTLLLSVFAGAALAGIAYADDIVPQATPLPMDEPTMVNGVDAVCTGIGDEAQTDPRWQAYPIRVEFAGGTGQYVGNAVLTLYGANDTPEFTVRCNGPWLLLQLAPGKYKVAVAADGAAQRTETISVPQSGQARAVIRFADIVGPR
ncbi:MAG: hypothetical protein H7Z40_13935 [Phycisphaerae bacterium]|nr:hypothetical protein [Gemmatimonadaceae bacterium]